MRKYKESCGYYLYSYACCLRNELLELLNKGRDAEIAFVKTEEWKDKVTHISVFCKEDTYDDVKERLSGSSRYHNFSFDKIKEIQCVTSFGIPVLIYFTEAVSGCSPVRPVLHGDLHMHTKWSDGKHSIEEMADYAAKLGRRYIGISDHSYSLKVARGISEVDALQQIEEIHALKLKGINVLSSIEVEVLKDGTLDFSDAILAGFDCVIAGIHTHLQQEPTEMRARLEKALSNPYVNILAHPTGKLTGRPGVLFSDREPYSLPFKEILDICTKNNVVLELNCFPERFDVGTEHFEEIIKSGAFISVGTDAHSAAHLNCLEYAEMMLARYPKLKKKVINTFSYNKLKRFFAGQRQTGDSVMSVTIIFGGQFGSEGKGKAAHYFTQKEKADYCIRVGGPNSGHTVCRNGEKIIFRILPTGIIEDHVTAVLPAGSYINLSILKEEMKAAGVSDERLLIDDNAVIISDAFMEAEKRSGLRQHIGSTESGTGAAVIARIERKEGRKLLAREFPQLKTCDTKRILREACDTGKSIIAEGTQGFGLSLLHAKEYPYVTSRDTSAASILSECGLSPFDVRNIIMVIRSFPIRVSGKSGDLPKEINWNILRDELRRNEDMTEYTSCTNRIRRVARFDADVVVRSILCNRPNRIVLNHLDYVDKDFPYPSDHLLFC